MTDSFPSIWIELKQNSGENILISGFYREWANNQDKSMEGQITRIKAFSKQIEQASESNKNKNIIIMGDANLDINKWDDLNFLHKNVSTIIRDTLSQNGISIYFLGDTYVANHAQQNGNIAHSTIDHIYAFTLPKRP